VAGGIIYVVVSTVLYKLRRLSSPSLHTRKGLEVPVSDE